MKNIEWIFCEQCDCFAVICPKCGNNACNGTYGHDGKCLKCPEVYNYQEECYKTGNIPTNSDNIRIVPKMNFR